MEQAKALGNKLLAQFPQAQSEYQKGIAAAEADAKEKAFSMAKDVGKRRVESGSFTPASTRTDVVPGTKDLKGGNSVSEAEAKKADYGDQIIQSVKVIKSGPQLNDKDLKRLNQNMLDMAAAAERGTKDMVGAAKVQGMRALGLSPDSLTDGLPKEKKAVALAWLNATGLVIRNQSGAAVTVPEDLRNWQVKGPQPGEGAEGYKRKLANVEYEGNNMPKMAGVEANRCLRGEVGESTRSYDYTNARANIPAPSKEPAKAPAEAAPLPTGKMSKKDKEIAVTVVKVLNDPKASPEDKEEARKYQAGLSAKYGARK